MRIGTKKRPFYRVVAVDERSKRTGGYIENLGTYNPLTEPKEIKLNQERIDYWIKKGAQSSVGFLRIIGKAPKRAPRKPRKEAKATPAAIVQPAAAPTAEQPAVPAQKEQPVEEVLAAQAGETIVETAKSETETQSTEEKPKEQK